MTQPQVRSMNHVSGRGLVLAAEGYVAFELLEGGIVDGDFVDGNFTSHGPCTWTNVTSGKPVRVYVHQLMVNGEAIRTHPRL
jgi:hypothetical protein